MDPTAFSCGQKNLPVGKPPVLQNIENLWREARHSVGMTGVTSKLKITKDLDLGGAF